ncbi:MAG TPA: hypothetical protein VN285_05890 [Candidatus Deferrimicrobium sp.]|nr:hypothetical protein [Candidatus Deferrimicrobium sp.]
MSSRVIQIIVTIIMVASQVTLAQHLVRLTDEQWIEMSVDLIRKGVQEEDTTKVFMAAGSELTVKGGGIQTKTALAGRLQAVFDQSSERTILLQRPLSSREDHPVNYSNFWDFDILDSRISISGDSAYVDCELVLWGAPSNEKGMGPGVRTSEQFVFISPPPVPRQPVGIGSSRFTVPAGKKSAVTGRRSWQFVGMEHLVEFLESQIITANVPTQSTGGEKR